MKKGSRWIWVLLVALSLGLCFAVEAMAMDRIVFEGFDDPDNNGVGDWEIYYVGLPDTTPKRVTNNSYDDIDPCISPDANKVVFAAKKNNGKFGIYLKNLVTGVETTLCESVDTAVQPAFSTNRAAPDWIVFSAIPTGETDYEIYKVKTDGTGLFRLTWDGYNDQAPSHNGTYIVFQSNRGPNSNNPVIMRMAMNGTGLTPLTNTNYYDMDPAIHSSGDTVVFASNRNDTQAEIYIMNITGTTVQRVTMDSAVQTSPYFADTTTGDTVIFISHHLTTKGRIYMDTAPVPMTSNAWTLWVNGSGHEWMEMNSPSWAAMNAPDSPTNIVKTFQCNAADSGVRLTWGRGYPDDCEDTFGIWRSVDGSSHTYIGQTSDTSFFDTTVVNLRGHNVNYGVRGWNIAGSSDWNYSDTNFINWTNLWLQTTPVSSGPQGTQFKVDVMSDTVYYMDTLHASLTYDTNCFSTPTVRLGDATDTSVHPGTNLMVDMDTVAGRIEFLVNMLDVNSWVTSTATSGNPDADTSLVEIYLWATGPTGCCNLNLYRGETTCCNTLGDTHTMGDTAAREICVMNVTGTSFCIGAGAIGPPTCRGDVNCDSGVTILDITQLERCLLGFDGADKCYCNWANADANGDGKVSSADITAIERIVLGLPAAPAPAKMTTSEVIAKLRMRGVATNELKLWAGEMKNFDTLFCDLSYDPAKVRIEKIEVGDLAEGARILSNIQNEQGRARVLINMPGVSGANGSGELLKITLAQAASAGDISVNEIILGSDQAIELPFELLNPESIPSRSFLSQNYPNPINPETWIPFSLSNSARVVINVYSLSGQLIRTLDLGEKAAGIYEIKDKAAYWDGKDNHGHETASGIYLYQLKAGDFTSTRKMIVLK
ncbi:MAG: FlgD immunoglobulin-like domain containing protein [bacterium]|nr:FlgD immunoglobulin-like domain containing protein [bacterium]